MGMLFVYHLNAGDFKGQEPEGEESQEEGRGVTQAELTR